MDAKITAELSKLDPTVPFRASTTYRHRTWARTFHCRPELYIQPHTLAEIQKVVTLARRCRRRVVLVGSGHCPSDITCTSAWMVNLDGFAQVLNVDEEKRTITVEAGIRMHDLNIKGQEHGLTMPNLGSIDVQSIAGAIATGTHGSSLYHGTLADYVVSLRIMLANGQTVKCSAQQNTELFQAALVSLGALGIVVEVEYKMVPATNIEWVQTLKPLSHVLETWDSTLWTQAEFTRVWWLPYLQRAIVWRAQKTHKEHREPQSNWYGGAIGYHTYQALLWISNWVPQILPAIEWFVFGMQYGFSCDSSVDAVGEQRTELLMNCLYSQFVNEWALPLSKGPEAINRLGAWINGDDPTARIPFSSRGIWVHSPIEVRIADTSKNKTRGYLDISCPTEPTLYLNATLYRAYGVDPPCKKRYYEAFEWLMRDMGARPHWAKNFQTVERADFEEMYGSSLSDWRRVRREADPEGLFVGEWLRRNVLEDERYPLACEEVEAGRRKRGSGGVDWFGKQAVESPGLRPRSRRSSNESFDYLAGAEAEQSMLFEESDAGETPERRKERTGETAGGVKVFEQM
jgi:D-arabinono-1,4-lactone oxidase